MDIGLRSTGLLVVMNKVRYIFMIEWKVMRMNWNLWAVILSILVVIIGLYEIFALGEYTWTNYLSTFLFAVVVVLILNSMNETQ